MKRSTGERQDNINPALFKRGLRGNGRRARGLRAERGSLLILCVTVLVIIALLGIAYLQRVRMDQFASSRHERDYMDLVINGILGRINTELKDDIFENWKDGEPLYDYPWTLTAHNAEAINGAGVPKQVNGSDDNEDDRWLASSAPVYVPPPSVAVGEYRWLHLTNLEGIWLNLPVRGHINQTEPGETLINGGHGDINFSDTDIKLNGPDGLDWAPSPRFQIRGVDADADGVLDSRWQWAPTSVRNMGGRKYVMALRIVDLSSMLDVNTATGLTSNGGTASFTAGMGENPSWVDLSRLFSRIAPFDVGSGANIAPSDWDQELIDALEFRGNNVGLSPLNPLPLSRSNIDRFWKQQGSIYGNVDRNYLIDSELELRRGGGINDTKIVSTLEIQMGKRYAPGQQVSKLLRQHPAIIAALGGPGSPEASYAQVVGFGTTNQDQRISRWFYGSDPGNSLEPDTNRIRVNAREFWALRHMLTTQGGSGAYVAKYGGAQSGGGLRKFDINDQSSNLSELRERLEQVFNLPGEKTSTYLGLLPNDLEDLIWEYALAIKDYTDDDNQPTQGTLADGTTLIYGMERLPFLREVYVQALYVDKDILDAGGVDHTAPGYIGPGPDNMFDTWVYDQSPQASGGSGDTRAVVIELGNPFEQPINEVADLDGRVRIVVNGGADGTWEFDSASGFAMSEPDILGRIDSLAGNDEDILIVYSPPLNKLDESFNPGPGPRTGSDLPGDLGFDAPTPTAVKLELTSGELTFDPSSGGTMTVELQVKVLLTVGPNAGTEEWKTYDRMAAASFLPGGSISHVPDAVANHRHLQGSYSRDCGTALTGNINYVVDEGPLTRVTQVRNLNLPAAYSATAFDSLGSDNKGASPIALTNAYRSLKLFMPRGGAGGVADMAWIHMFGFTETQPFSQRMNDPAFLAPNPNQHFLVIDPSDPGYDVTLGTGLPRPALLMDIFTTVSPLNDNRDNDNDDGNNIVETSGDSADNDTEQFIPGTINVNTMPLHLLTLGMPSDEPTDDTERLMRSIVAYRDEPIRGRDRIPAENHDDYWAAAPLMGFDPQDARDLLPVVRPFVNGPFTDKRLNQPGIASVGELMYLNLNPLAGAPTNEHHMTSQVQARAGDLLDNNEGMLTRFRQLSQAYTVRSDRFVVYGIVRGYRDGQFNQAEIESAQFIAVFDRSSMKDKDDDNPHVIGFVRLQ